MLGDYVKNVHPDKLPKKVLKELVLSEKDERLTISFYQYHHLRDPETFREELRKRWEPLKVFGRVYIANEGINAQISVPEKSFEAFKQNLYEIDFLNGVRLNIAVDDDGKSFFKLKIKVRPKIVADGLDDASFDVTNRGKHLTAEEFNALTDQPETVVVDMRNHYESEVGHFENAILPDVDTFRDSLPIVADMLKDKKNRPVVMYCTGGIRCEKASAYMKHNGFENVYQLEGGIIKYAQDVKKKGLSNKFRGKNFVFDERLGERISDEVISRCHQCGKPSDRHTNCKNDACHLLFIQCEECASRYEGCCSTACVDFIHLPEEQQKELRSGIDRGRQVYKKGRLRPRIDENDLITKSLREDK